MNWVNWSGNGIVMMKETSMIEAAWRLYKQYKQQRRSAVQTSVSQASTTRASTTRASTSQASALPKDLHTAKLSVVSSFAENLTPKQSPKRAPLHMPLHAPQQKLHSVQAAMSVAVTDKTEPQKPRPMGTLTEIRSYSSSDFSISEEHGTQSGLQPLLPALAGFCRDRWLVLVSPPRRPNIAELRSAGIDPARVLLVHADASNRPGVSGVKGGLKSNGLKSNGLKIVEQALRSGNCGAVLAWLQACDVPTLQRLRRAAVAGQAWGVMFREGDIETKSEGEGKSDLTMSAEQRRFVPSSIQPTKPLAEKEQRGMAQVVSIHCGSDKPSACVNDDSAGRKTETVQLEMAIN